MRKVPIAVLTTIIVLACSCTSQPSPPATGPSHPYLPQQFEMRYSSASVFGGGSVLIFENGYLVRKEYASKKSRHGYEDVLAKTEYFVPGEERWREFWNEMKRLRIWEWRNRYHPSDVGGRVDDGGGWHLLMAYRGRAIDTAGENAGPKPNFPETTVVVPDGWNGDLTSAISRLIGKEG